MSKYSMVLFSALSSRHRSGAQGPHLVFFVCGNKDHRPSHSAGDLDAAKYSRVGMGAGTGMSTHRVEAIPCPYPTLPTHSSDPGSAPCMHKSSQLNAFATSAADASRITQLHPGMAQPPVVITVTLSTGPGVATRYRIVASSRPTAAVRLRDGVQRRCRRTLRRLRTRNICGCLTKSRRRLDDLRVRLPVGWHEDGRPAAIHARR